MPALQFPKELRDLAHLFQEEGGVLYAVGGQIRNPLLGYPVSDRDICSALTPERVMALCDAHSIAYVPQGLAYGTVAIHTGGGIFEHTTFRSDVYAPGGAHKPSGVCFGTDIAADAHRRDFTVNALYADILRPDTIIDPTGRGLSDLNARRLRASSADPRVILRDDALRILRLVRFACELDFCIEEATLAAAKLYAENLHSISAERKRDELNKLLCADVRYAPSKTTTLLAALHRLDELGALAILLPELAACRGIAQRADYHAYDVMEHMLQSCACAALPQSYDAEDKQTLLALRLAALLHDVGKPEAKRRNLDIPAAHGHMYGHDALGAKIAREMLARLKYPNAMTERVCALIGGHMFDLTGTARESTLRAQFSKWGYERSLLNAALREADVRGSGRTAESEPVTTAVRFYKVLAVMRAQNAPFSESELNCTGADIMRWTGLGPGAQIGEIKAKLLTHCACRPKDNTLGRLESVVRGMGMDRG